MSATPAEATLATMPGGGGSSEPKVHASAVTPGWQFDDFFKLDPTQELTLRKQLANYFGIRYGDSVNKSKHFAVAVSGLPVYSEDMIVKHLKAQEALVAGQVASSEACTSLSLVVSGLLVAWNTNVPLNVGYVQSWAEQNLANWDVGVERKAGGFDRKALFSAQHFHCTNRSSLMAMIASVVFNFKSTGSVPEKLGNAFCSVRLLLYPEASPDEIMVHVAQTPVQGNRGPF